MPVHVERIANEPILIATMTGNVLAEDFKTMYHQSAALIGAEAGVFYRITDVREATTTFVEMLKAIQVATEEMASSALGDRIQVTFVGTTSWINLARDVFMRRGITMAAFPDMDEALESVRIRIAAEKRNAGALPET